MTSTLVELIVLLIANDSPGRSFKHFCCYRNLHVVRKISNEFSCIVQRLLMIRPGKPKTVFTTVGSYFEEQRKSG